MKKILSTLLLCALSLPTLTIAMHVTRRSYPQESPTINIIQAPLTKEDYAIIRNDVEQKWLPVEQKLRAFAHAQRHAKRKEDSFVFEPLFVAITPPTPRHIEDNQLVQEIRRDIKHCWPKVEEKWLSLFCKPFDRDLQQLSLLPVDATESMRELSEILDQAHNNYPLVGTNRKALERSLLVATTSAGVLALQQQRVIDPLIRLLNPTRNPLALAGAGLSLLDSSKKTLVTIAGISLVYLGGKSALKSFDNWLHGTCREKEKALESMFIQKLAELEKKIDAHEAALIEKITSREKALKEEALKIATQARENAFDALLKQDKFEKSITPHLQDLEQAQKDINSHVIKIEQNTEKVRKQVLGEVEKTNRKIEKVSKEKKVAFNYQINDLKKQIHDIQEKAKGFSKGDQTIANNEAFAILSQEIQRLGSTMDQLAPSHSHRSSRAPSEAGTYTSRAPSQQPSRTASPSESLFSSRIETHSRPRPQSSLGTQQVEDFLHDIKEEHSSASESEKGGVRIILPTPPKASPSEELSLTQKPTSPHRRRSICTALFGRKEPKDTHDPRS